MTVLESTPRIDPEFDGDPIETPDLRADLDTALRCAVAVGALLVLMLPVHGPPKLFPLYNFVPNNPFPGRRLVFLTFSPSLTACTYFVDDHRSELDGQLWAGTYWSGPVDIFVWNGVHTIVSIFSSCGIRSDDHICRFLYFMK